MLSELKTERQGQILLLTLCGPDSHNALSEQLLAAGIEALNVAGDDQSVRAIVMRGEGAHFCAGQHAPSLQARRRPGAAAEGRMLEALAQFVEALRTIPKPVIAAVEGAAEDAGFSLALACDLIVAAEDARFMLGQARLGLTPEGGATWHLMHSLPRQLVQQWIWLAEPLGARHLYTLGLVHTISNGGHATDDALKLAQRLAAMAPNAVAGAKELLRLATQQGLARQLESERGHFMENLSHPNAGEGLQAIQDKRAPCFR
jgi:enoyl-CoA hydratase/carnithine racemase